MDVSLLVAVAQFLGLPGRLSYCCEREILPEVMLEAWALLLSN